MVCSGLHGAHHAPAAATGQTGFSRSHSPPTADVDQRRPDIVRIVLICRSRLDFCKHRPLLRWNRVDRRRVLSFEDNRGGTLTIRP